MDLNLRLTTLSLLKDVESFEQLCEAVVTIREIFQFSGGVTVKEMPTLLALEKEVGMTLPDWVIGLGGGNTIWILEKSKWENQKMDVSQLILHEFVHIAVNLTIKKDVPLWLNEALAVYLSGQHKDYKLNNHHIYAEVDFYALSYSTEYLYIIVTKTIIALVKHYGIDAIIKELMECENFETSNVFCNANLNQLVKEYIKG